ncbi:MAG: alpha/beta fold hydrolase [Steroidobacteraceae bacterium]
MKIAAAMAILAVLNAGPALSGAIAGASVVVTVDHVRVAQGRIRATLCDQKASFMRGCATYSSTVKARLGSVDLVFPNVRPGNYALFAFHDRDDSGAVRIPPDGWAFGNDARFPPTFDAASLAVRGNLRTRITLHYLGGSGAPAGRTGVTDERSSDTSLDVQAIPLRQGGLVGEFYRREHQSARRPALLVVSGADGSLEVVRELARPFASKGYDVLALAYWGHSPLPTSLELIPLEYFERGIDWLLEQPSVDSRHIGMIGWSRGAEAALLVAAHDPKITAVVAISPSSRVWPGMPSGAAWTLAGRALPAMPFPAPTKGAPRSMRQMFAAALMSANAPRDASIPVERINGPILLLTGSDDRIWPSNLMADQIVARLGQQHFRYTYRHVDYPGAGHAVFVAGVTDAHHIASQTQLFGGTSAANRAAWADSWPRVLAFLDTALK